MPMISRGTWITCISIRSSTAWSAAPRIGDGRALVRGRRAACTTLIGGMARPRIFALVNDVGSGTASDGDFGCAAVDALAESIKAQGILQPILVRRHPDRPNGLAIFAGERRWRGAQRAKRHGEAACRERGG